MATRARRRRSIGRNLCLIVDGRSDRVFWNHHLKEHFPRAAHKVHNLEGSDPVAQFDRIVEEAIALGCAYVVFLTDEDASPDPAIRVKRLKKKISELQARNRRLANKVKVFGVRPCLEAWFLADDKAIRSVLTKTKYRCKRKTDALTNPKATARRLYEQQYRKDYSWTPDGFAAEMVCKIDFDRAAKWSDSLKAFWREMGETFAKWR